MTMAAGEEVYVQRSSTTASVRGDFTKKEVNVYKASNG